MGDWIDRGPDQEGVLTLVRAMHEEGQAKLVLGNHELNAMAYGAQDEHGQPLRRHSEKNQRQHAAFLREFPLGSPRHRAWLEWMQTVPLWVEEEGVRVVHACWAPQHQRAWLAHSGGQVTVSLEALVAAHATQGSAWEALEALTKGLEVELPDGIVHRDAEGHERTASRTKWWDTAATTYPKAVLDREVVALLPERELPSSVQPISIEGAPVFFGHYWRQGQPCILGSKVACVDYSAARDAEPLVAYAWQGETELTNAHWVIGGRS